MRASTLPLQGDSTGYTHCTTTACATPPRLYSLSLAGSFCRYYTDSLPLSGTGLFFLWRCQNPTIHSHRVISHPARAKKGKEEEGWTTEKHRNLGISHFRFFLLLFLTLPDLPHEGWSQFLQHLLCQKHRPKAPTFSSAGRITSTRDRRDTH